MRGMAEEHHKNICKSNRYSGWDLNPGHGVYVAPITPEYFLGGSDHKACERLHSVC
jgi:hypothetical protein